MTPCQFAAPLTNGMGNSCGLGLYGGRPSHGVCEGCIRRGENNAEFAASYKPPTATTPPPTLPQMAGSSLPIAGSGVGTELKALLKRIGITASPNCSCSRRAAEMNARGIEWCEQNIPTIVGWLREEAERRGLPFVDLAGTTIVKLAIRRAKKQDQVS